MVHFHDATPPADFPAQLLVLDRALGKRQPKHAFYLRVQVSDREVKTVDLYGAVSLNDARRMAEEQEYAPTHWLEISEDNDKSIGPFRLP